MHRSVRRLRGQARTTSPSCMRMRPPPPRLDESVVCQWLHVRLRADDHRRAVHVVPIDCRATAPAEERAVALVRCQVQHVAQAKVHRRHVRQLLTATTAPSNDVCDHGLRLRGRHVAVELSVIIKRASNPFRRDRVTEMLAVEEDPARRVPEIARVEHVTQSVAGPAVVERGLARGGVVLHCRMIFLGCLSQDTVDHHTQRNRIVCMRARSQFFADQFFLRKCITTGTQEGRCPIRTGRH
eukprot:4871062-Prymnesium_polylepis.1